MAALRRAGCAAHALIPIFQDARAGSQWWQVGVRKKWGTMGDMDIIQRIMALNTPGPFRAERVDEQSALKGGKHPVLPDPETQHGARNATERALARRPKTTDCGAGLLLGS